MSRATKLRSMWNSRVGGWHEHVQRSPAFDAIRAAVLDAARAGASDRVVDLGAGSGFIALALADSVDTVVAVDLAPRMLQVLDADAAERGLTNVSCTSADLAVYDLPPASVDVVVSCYALHHLADADKAALIRRAKQWLRPGGRIVIADMMFGRGATAQDRLILKQKVVALARKGPAGVWRIAKNLVRFGLRVGSERPASPSFWTDTLTAAGFSNVEYRSIVGEAGLVVGFAQ
ncbi:MAG: methyltransferase domain-containing protein [Acidimicrobiales bacterium]|nr:methyltransferase domain-containing protein [Acidimicrobiales bacterium]